MDLIFLISTGLCKSSTFDYYFGWPPGNIGDETFKYELYGTKQSVIRWEKTHWKLFNYGLSQTYAICNETSQTSDEQLLPFGVCTWYVFNDSCEGGKISFQMQNLSLSRCSDDEYPCPDGTW